MSVYNEPMGWLKGSIESMLGQTFGDFEFIIVNDNPDRGDIGDLLDQYKNADSRTFDYYDEKFLNTLWQKHQTTKTQMCT